MRLGIYNSSGAWSPLSVIGGPRQATPIYIDELQCVNVDGNGRNSYPGGLPCKTVQTIPLPTVTTTANGVTQFACLGNYDFVEGAMQLSEDGRFLIVSCYDTPPGNTETRQGNRVACIIDWTGNVDCSTSISWGNGLSKNYWSAYTPNGVGNRARACAPIRWLLSHGFLSLSLSRALTLTRLLPLTPGYQTAPLLQCDIYMSGDSGFQAKGGIQYTYRGLSGQSWPILAPSSSYNSVISTSSYGGQLYAMVGTGWSSSPPAMPRGVMAVGGKNAGSTVAAWTAVGAYPRAPGSATMVFVAGLQTSCLDFQGRPTPTCTFGDACELSASWPAERARLFERALERASTAATPPADDLALTPPPHPSSIIPTRSAALMDSHEPGPRDGRPHHGE